MALLFSKIPPDHSFAEIYLALLDAVHRLPALNHPRVLEFGAGFSSYMAIRHDLISTQNRPRRFVTWDSDIAYVYRDMPWLSPFLDVRTATAVCESADAEIVFLDGAGDRLALAREILRVSRPLAIVIHDSERYGMGFPVSNGRSLGGPHAHVPDGYYGIVNHSEIGSPMTMVMLSDVSGITLRDLDITDDIRIRVRQWRGEYLSTLLPTRQPSGAE